MKMIKSNPNKRKSAKKNLVREIYGDYVYEYYPLGKYVVAAPGVCGGRPTFKYSRLEVRMILALIAAGETIEQVVQNYSLSRLTPEAVSEAISLANKAFIRSAKMLQAATS